jgi:hypothetical protein
MIHTLRSRITGRTLELELLITTCLLLRVGLGSRILGAGDVVRWMDLAITGAFSCSSRFSWRCCTC